jgi:glycosyltransferase involved in cell wall biosynthesis
MQRDDFKLFYFTLSYPWGLGEEWKKNELNILRNYFPEITVVPYSHDDNFHHPKPLPNGVKSLNPLFPASNYFVPKSRFLEILRNKHRFIFMSEFFRNMVFLKRKRASAWLESTLKTIDILSHQDIIKILEDADEKTVFYFYWGKGLCQIMPFISKVKLRSSFVRMHRFDLFEYVNDNYIPYRKFLLKSITTAGPSSLAGKIHLDEKYPFAKSKTKVFRCGTKGNGLKSSPSNDGVLRLISCSYLSPVKRVNMMISSLQYLEMAIEWHHIGDGVLRDELEDLVAKLHLEKKFIFHGMIDSREILDFYTRNSFDYFVNVSESEGVPFSIMEAFAAGIPVLATDVGGTGEIVDNSVGRLMPSNITPKELAGFISRLYEMDESSRTAMREKAYERYNQRCNADILGRELAEYLIQ